MGSYWVSNAFAIRFRRNRQRAFDVLLPIQNVLVVVLSTMDHGMCWCSCRPKGRKAGGDCWPVFHRMTQGLACFFTHAKRSVNIGSLCTLQRICPHLSFTNALFDICLSILKLTLLSGLHHDPSQACVIQNTTAEPAEEVDPRASRHL